MDFAPGFYSYPREERERPKGWVANKFDYDLVNIRAKGVPGVFSVNNDLQIER
jgi:hypothetical protein